MADELAMLTRIGAKDQPVEEKFLTLLHAMHGKRPEQIPFSPWGRLQGVEAIQFTRQLSQLTFALDQANDTARSGLR